MADTHSQLQAAHEAELESTSANHAAELSSIAATYSTDVGELRAQVDKLQQELKRVVSVKTDLSGELERMGKKLKEVERELGVAKEQVENSKGGEEAEKRLEVVLKELAGVKDELEGTKEVCHQVSTVLDLQIDTEELS